MLYQLHEMQRALFTPFAQMAEVGAEMFTNPYSPLSYSPVAKRAAAGYELIHRLGKDYPKPEWHIDSVEVNGKTCPVQIVTLHKKPFCNLIHFRRLLPAGSKPSPKVLLVAPMSGHHATLLRDTVRSLIQDHDVYVTDWIDAKMVPISQGSFHLNDYVKYVQEFIHVLGEKVHTISVCQPTVPVLAAVSLMATNKDPLIPLSMTMMGGPIDPRKSPTEVNNLAVTHPFTWFETNLIHRVTPNYPGAGRRVYPGFLQHLGFVAMNPSRHFKSYQDFYEDLVVGETKDAEFHRQFYDEYNAVLDLDAEFYLETIQTVFKDYALPTGTWDVDGQLVRPQDIKTTALLTIEGELDDISGSGQTKAAHELCTSIPKEKREHYTVIKAGHYGIFSGSRWRDIVYPKIRDHIAKYNNG